MRAPSRSDLTWAVQTTSVTEFVERLSGATLPRPRLRRRRPVPPTPAEARELRAAAPWRTVSGQRVLGGTVHDMDAPLPRPERAEKPQARREREAGAKQRARAIELSRAAAARGVVDDPF